MIKYSSLFALFICTSSLLAQIKEIDCVSTILQDVTAESIVFFDIDDTLIQLPITLGNKAWRRYAMHVLNMSYSIDKATSIHDKITYFIATHVPYKATQENVNSCLNELKLRKIPVFGCTARGREHWYDMPSSDSEELTLQHLRQAGIDLNFFYNDIVDKTLLIHPSYAQKIFFAYPIEDKGELMLELFSKNGTRPSQAIFIDDKMDNIRAVDKAFTLLKIPSFCYYFHKSESIFDPMVANIQLEKLIDGIILSDDEAIQLKDQYLKKNPEEFFLELASKF